MTKLILFSALSALALVAGAGAGAYLKMTKRTLGRFAAFGSGVLICALTIGLMDEAFGLGGFDAIISGFFLGGICFIIGDYLIHMAGGRRHKKHLVFNNSGSGTNGLAITLGAIMDGIPESIALGIAIFMGEATGLLMMVAIVLSNFPEAISSVLGLLKSGYKSGRIVLLWALVGSLMFIVAIGSYFFLHDISLNSLGFAEAFAAGAILAMLADGMMPEAYREGGLSTGLMTVLGFLVAFVVAKV